MIFGGNPNPNIKKQRMSNGTMSEGCKWLEWTLTHTHYGTMSEGRKWLAMDPNIISNRC